MIIVQIGSNDGNDHVYDYATQHIDEIEKIILVDANPFCEDAISQRYSKFHNVQFFNYAIIANEYAPYSYMILHRPMDDKISQHSSTLIEHMNKHGHNDLESIQVDAISMNSFFKKLNLTHIDRLYIDVEGLDIDIVNSIDFSKYDIRYLEFEFIHSDGTLSWGGANLDKCLSRLTSFGFNHHKKDYNIVAMK